MDEMIGTLPTVLLRVVCNYAKPPCNTLFLIRSAPFISVDLLRRFEDINTPEDLDLFCDEHALTSDDFDRPTPRYISMWSLTLMSKSVLLVKYMVQQRLRRAIPWNGLPATYPANIPVPDLLYSTVAGSVFGSPLHGLLLSRNSTSLMEKIEFVCEEASDLINIGGLYHSALYTWLITVPWLFPTAAEKALTDQILKFLLRTGALLKTKEISLLDVEMVKNLFVRALGMGPATLMISFLKCNVY